MYIELIMVGDLHIAMAFIHFFQQIKSMSKSSRLCEALERQRAGFCVPKLSFVRKILDGRLASKTCSDNARKLLSIFDKFVKSLSCLFCSYSCGLVFFFNSDFTFLYWC